MSLAKECDRCGELYKLVPGALSILELGICRDAQGVMDTWSGIDFCPTCSESVRAAIGEAIHIRYRSWSDVPADEVRCDGDECWDPKEAQQLGVDIETWSSWRLKP